MPAVIVSSSAIGLVVIFLIVTVTIALKRKRIAAKFHNVNEPEYATVSDVSDVAVSGDTEYKIDVNMCYATAVKVEEKKRLRLRHFNHLNYPQNFCIIM